MNSPLRTFVVQLHSQIGYVFQEEINPTYTPSVRGGTTSSESQNILHYVIPELQIQARSYTHTPVAAYYSRPEKCSHSKSSGSQTIQKNQQQLCVNHVCST